ncbi:MAG: carbohydrate ABC transporter permease [Clostridia bacterium]|nr:carbohydrate ABC transporter permease [Clostridia bacterium]
MTVLSLKHRKRNRIRETRKDRIFNTFNLLFWILVLFIVLYPLWLILIASVSDPDAVLQAKVLLWPVDFSLMGYETVLQNSELLRSYVNSIFYTVVGSALSVIITLAAAYALSRKFAGKKLVNLAITFTMFFSGGLIPIFLNVLNLGLWNTRAIMILMNLVSVWNLMVARTYIQTTIPEDLYEAAVIDGSNHFTYFFKCVLPLSGTIVAVLSVYYGVARWNDYFTAQVMLRDRALFPLQRVLREILASLTSTGSSDTFFAAYADNLGGLQAALRKAEVAKYCCIVVATVPAVFLYIFMQKYFVKGVMIGSVKG